MTELAPGEEPYLKLLEALRRLGGSPSEAAVVSRIARFAQSVRLLDLVAAEPRWYASWEVREALLANPHTGERLREPLGTSFAVLDLMRELDGKTLGDAEREEIREDIRSLIRSLPRVDVDAVRARAKALAASGRPGRPAEAAAHAEMAAAAPGEEAAAEAAAAGPHADAAELPAPPAEVAPEPEEDAAALSAAREAATTAAAISAASVATDPQALLEALADPRDPVRRSALHNPSLPEGVLLEAIQMGAPEALLAAILEHPLWASREPVRRALRAAGHAPEAVRETLSTTDAILLQFRRYFNEPLEEAEKGELAKELLGSVQQLPPTEREVVKSALGEAWPPFVRAVMQAIERDFRNLKPVPVTTGLKPVPPAVPMAPEGPATVPMSRHQIEREMRASALTLPPQAPIEPDLPHAVPARPAEALGSDRFDAARRGHAPLHERQVTGEVRRSLAHLPVEERIRIAAASTQRDELAFLLHDADDRVFAALLRNPAVADEERVAAARNASLERVKRLVADREVYALIGIKRALLHNPHTPESVQLECLHHVGLPRELLLVMRDPKVRSLEVKAKARSRLQERYRAMGPNERVAAIKQTGGELLSELWTETFQDERTMLKLIADHSLDEAVVLRIVRSRIAPREVLAAIGREPSFLGSYAVRLELASNPKTPRELVTKLLPRLNPQDRERLRTSRQVPDSVRGTA